MRFFEKLAWHYRAQHKAEEEPAAQNQGQGAANHPRALSQDLDQNLTAIKAEFRGSVDLVVRSFSFGGEGNGALRAGLIYLDGMSNLIMINDAIIRPLMYDLHLSPETETADLSSLDKIRERLLAVSEVTPVCTYDEVTQACLSGNAALLVEGFSKALSIGVKGWEKRAVSEPTSETALRAPREGFTENLRTNTSMIRRMIKDPALKIHDMVIGARTHTQINLLYIDGLASPALIQEVERRLNKINTDAILAAGYVEQYIEDSPMTVFPTIWSSEKPDAVAGKLLEGRVAVAVDGAPFVMTMPMLFIENFQSSEDYIARPHYATVMRVLRLISFFICLFAPALYIALSTYHQELIPTTLLFSMAAASEGTPFPAAVEMGVMMLIFSILREAGIRMPRPVGQTISIVGALVMGEAAIQAGIVGAPVVIVVAITAVASFSIPFITDAIMILSWFLLVLATTMGSFGITIGGFMILVHLTALRSFGSCYMAPMAPLQKADLKDTAVRAPLWAMRNRPNAIKPRDLKRQNFQIPYYPAADQNNGGGES